MTSVVNQKHIALVPLCNTQKQICHYILNKITFTWYLPKKKKKNACFLRCWAWRWKWQFCWYAAETGKTQRHKRVNRKLSKTEKNISSDSRHTFSAQTNDKTRCKWCGIDENNLTLFMSVPHLIPCAVRRDILWRHNTTFIPLDFIDPQKGPRSTVRYMKNIAMLTFH